MREKGFDQLPVSAYSSGGKAKLVGLVTLGNLLSYMSSGRISPQSKVEDVMFDFRRLNEVVTDLGHLHLEGEITGEGKKKSTRKEFVEITRDTKLSDLNRFFEWNSAAVVTERVEGEIRAVAVVTKVDLLSWLVRRGGVGANGDGK
jgi:cystathionine beta-synthase